MTKHKKSFLHRISDVSKIHHRAAFADVEYRINKHKHIYDALLHHFEAEHRHPEPENP